MLGGGEVKATRCIESGVVRMRVYVIWDVTSKF